MSTFTISSKAYYVPLGVQVQVISEANLGQVKVSRSDGPDILVSVADLKVSGKPVREETLPTEEETCFECGQDAYEWCSGCGRPICGMCANKQIESGLLCSVCFR